jgi:hypothetical protein
LQAERIRQGDEPFFVRIARDPQSVRAGTQV